MTNTDAPQLLPRLVHPYPRSAQWGTQSLLIDSKIRIQFGREISLGMRRWMVDLWRRYTFDRIPVEISDTAIPGGSPWSWRIGDGELPAVADSDSYALEVSAAGVAAIAINENGAKDAWKTLLQLLWLRDIEASSACLALPYVTIHDGPVMAFRGLHVCVFPESSHIFIEKVIQLAGLLKYSHVVLEFWGTLEMEALPELSWPTAWSKRQAAALIQRANAWGVEVVPMYNMWGHAASCRHRWGRHVVLDQNPALSPLFEPDGWTWCLSHPRTGPLLRQIASELSELAGPGSFFHIGCDESYSHATCDRCRTGDRVGLWADHVNAMAEHVVSLGRRPIMWGDPLLERGRWPGGDSNGTPFLPTHKAIDRIDRRIIIADWHYDVKEGDVPTISYFKSKGFEVLASPWHELPNIRTMAQAAQHYDGLGVLATTWHRLSQNMPMLVAAANGAWSAQAAAMEEPHWQCDRMSTYLAAHLRRLVPSGGDYSNSGWHPFELSMQE